MLLLLSFYDRASKGSKPTLISIPERLRDGGGANFKFASAIRGFVTFRNKSCVKNQHISVIFHTNILPYESLNIL